MERTRTSWSGDLGDLADAIVPLVKDGPIDYMAGQEDPADEAAMVRLTPQIVKMANKVPKHNARWSTLVRAVLSLIRSGTITGAPTHAAARKTYAELEATKIRNIDLHIRKQWYRKTNKAWMLPFPNPSGPPQLDPVAAAPLPVHVAATALDAHAVAASAATSPVDAIAPPGIAASSIAANPPGAAGPAFGLSPPRPPRVDHDSLQVLSSVADFAGPDPFSVADEVGFNDVTSDSDSEDSVSNELQYQYGFVDEDTAWRHMVTDDGIQHGDQEYTTIIEQPEPPNTLCTALFVDGTRSEIPGMFGKVSAAVGKPLVKKVATAAKTAAKKKGKEVEATPTEKAKPAKPAKPAAVPVAAKTPTEKAKPAKPVAAKPKAKPASLGTASILKRPSVATIAANKKAKHASPAAPHINGTSETVMNRPAAKVTKRPAVLSDDEEEEDDSDEDEEEDEEEEESEHQTEIDEEEDEDEEEMKMNMMMERKMRSRADIVVRQPLTITLRCWSPRTVAHRKQLASAPSTRRRIWWRWLLFRMARSMSSSVAISRLCRWRK